MRCVIWYQLYNLKNVKNTMEECLLKITLLHRYFSCFLNCTNGTKSRKTSVYQFIKHEKKMTRMSKITWGL